jgi:hypothetical protein
VGIELGTALVKKWAQRFGLGSYRLYVRSLSHADRESAEAMSWYEPAEEWGVVWLPDDSELPPETLELLVLHELAHGLLWNDDTELQCDRVARLAQGREDVPWPEEWKMLTNFDAFRSAVDPKTVEKRPWLAIVVDGLPKVERDVICALYWEGLTYVETCQRLGLARPTMFRHRQRALERLRSMFAALDKKFAKEGEGGEGHQAPSA